MEHALRAAGWRKSERAPGVWIRRPSAERESLDLREVFASPFRDDVDAAACTCWDDTLNCGVHGERQ
ncbi:MAG: hypothetical protein AB7O78_17740 [Thermoleophilia bacterium]